MQPISVKVLLEIILIVLAIGLVTSQCRKPAGVPGRLFLWIMNRSHASVTAWGLSHVNVERNFRILDVGCGGGQTIAMLAEVASDGTVHGIDYSAASVAAARRTNSSAIAAGRVDVRQGTVSKLPYPDASFDLVTAIETHYYWPDPVADLQEIRRVLKPGGKCVLVAETYKGRSFDALYRPAMKLLRATYLSVDEHRQLLADSGYAEVNIFEERGKGWLCGVGVKPA